MSADDIKKTNMSKQKHKNQHTERQYRFISIICTISAADMQISEFLGAQFYLSLAKGFQEELMITFQPQQMNGR